jgi:HPt (histidine-containing phosphotransfer) domain-containing protein
MAAMTKDDGKDGKIEALLADLWQRHLPTLRERLDLLTRIGDEASSGTLAEASRLEAHSIAHKLAGNLGMFGHKQATEIAGAMEQILKAPTPETLVTLAGLTSDLRRTLASAL